MAQGLPASAYWRVVRGNANFRRLWLAQIVSELGDWLYTVAVYSQLLHVTGGQAKSVALAFILQELPQLLVSPVAGVLNDRLSRRRLMIGADLARAGIVTLMLLAQTWSLVWLMYVLLFFETIFWALFEPARSAVIPNVTTSDEETVAANSLSSITWSVNFSLGFSIGGFLAVLGGPALVYSVNALSFLLSAVLIKRMRFTEPHLDGAPPLKWRDLADFSPVVEGIGYVRADPRLFTTLLVKTGLGLLGANWVVLTVLGERKFAVGAAGAEGSGTLGMSLLLAFRGLGALIGPLIAGAFTGASQQRMRTAILVGFLWSAVGYVALGYVGSLWLAGLCLVFAHAGSSLQWVYSTTLLQMNTDDKFRGRVFSAEFAFMTFSMTFSSAMAGLLIDWGVEAGQVAVLMGLAMLVPAAWWFWAIRLWR